MLRYFAEDSDSALYDDLRISYLSDVSQLPCEEHYDLLSLWAMHTWLIEAFQYSPILSLFSVAEKGKTRTGEGLTYIAYRGMPTVSLREAYILRMANNYGGTLFFDVMNIWKKAEQSGCEDIMLQRYQRGATVPRVNRPEAGAFMDTDYYSIFGPTIIATNISAHRILESRCIQINMQSSSRQFENDIKPENSLPVKERLCAFRARHIGKPLSDVDKPATGRLGDILKPLHQIMRLVRPERETEFLRLVKEIVDDRRGEKSDTIEAVVLDAVYALFDSIENGFLPVTHITDHINVDRSEQNKPYSCIKRKGMLPFLL